MAYVNKLLLMNKEKGNILDDDKLLETGWDDTGIAVNEVAYSARLNAILRQVTSVTHSLVQLAVDKKLGSYGSYTDGTIQQFGPDEVNKLLKTITLENAEDKNKTHNKNLVWASSSTVDGVTPSFRPLALSDIPTIVSSKIGGGEVKTINIADLNVTTGKIALYAVRADQLANDSVITDKIKNLNVTTGKLAELSVTTGKLAKSAVTFAKLGDGVIEGDYIKDSIISPKHSSVVGKKSDGEFANYNIVKMNLSEYNKSAFVKDPNTLYFLV